MRVIFSKRSLIQSSTRVHPDFNQTSTRLQTNNVYSQVGVFRHIKGKKSFIIEYYRSIYVNSKTE